MASRVPVAKEGWPFVIGPALAALGLSLLGHRRLAVPFWAASAASLGFFRDPERAIPAVRHGVLAPASSRPPRSSVLCGPTPAGWAAS